MSRVIKFRSWDGKRMILPDTADKYDFVIEPDGSIYYLAEQGYERHLYLFIRDEKTFKVMQFTGLLDKNGKEIYEGDILRTNWGGFDIESPVTWDGHGFWIKDDQGKNHMPFDRLIIGNIYENPELL